VHAAITPSRALNAANAEAARPGLSRNDSPLLSRGSFMQIKLDVGTTDDPLEREADRVADQLSVPPSKLNPRRAAGGRRLARGSDPAGDDVPVGPGRSITEPSQVIESDCAGCHKCAGSVAVCSRINLILQA
jgi:hypothetical protein